MAIAPSDTQVIYALVEAKKTPCIDQPTEGKMGDGHDKEESATALLLFRLGVDPSNENRLYSVFTYVNVSEMAEKASKS